MARREARGKPEKRYITSLDGLRALAVIAVIAYHLNLGGARGGLLGVTVFFVLSGYLITGLLSTELRQSGTIDLVQFWLRRIRRLFPAIVLVIVIVCALCVLFNHPLLTKMRPDIVPSLFWFQNWWYIFRGLSYFESLGDPSPLTHFWSLAIEEQFYVLWPLILLLVSRLGASRKFMRRGCLVLAAISALLMALLYNPHIDPTRVYYGTDTRAFSLLLGAWLSFVWPGQELTEESTRKIPQRTIVMLDAIGIIALAAIVFMIVYVDGFSSFMYRGGILLCSIFTTALIAVLVHPRSNLAKFASLKPFVWVGQRSYGMYLWHYPIILLLRPLNGPGPYSWWFAIAVFVLTFAVSAASYRFVENPLRHGALGKTIAQIRDRGFDFSALRRISVLVPTAATVAVLVIAIAGCSTLPDTRQVPRSALINTGDSAGSGKQIDAVTNHSYDSSDGVIGNAIAAVTNVKNDLDSAQAKAERASNIRNPLLIGDSVPGDSQNEFYSHYTNSLMDCYIGRWFWQARDVYKDYADQGVVGNVVIFACFTNFALENDELDKMSQLVGSDKEIFLVNIFTTTEFVQANNQMLSDYAKTHSNMHIIDWYSTVRGHEREYLWDDREHLRPEGAAVYEDLIFNAVKGFLPSDDIKQ